MEEEQKSKNNSLLYRLKLFYIKLEKTFVERLERFHDPNVQAFLNKHIKLQYENKIKSQVIFKQSEEKFISRLQRFIFEVVESMIAYIEILLEPTFNIKKQIIKSQRKYMYENIMLNIIDNKIDHIQDQNKECIQENVQLRVLQSQNKLKEQTAVRDQVDKNQLLFLELKDQKFGKSKPIQMANASQQKEEKQGFQDEEQVNFFAIQQIKQKWRRGVFERISKYKSLNPYDKIKIQKLSDTIPRYKEFIKEEGNLKSRSANIRQNYQFDLLKSQISTGKKRPFSREEQKFFSSSKFILSPEEREQVKKAIELEKQLAKDKQKKKKQQNKKYSVKKRLKRRI